MAYRDRTREFVARRENLKKRNMRFKLRQLAESAPYLPIFQPKSQWKSMGMDKALLQEAREFAGLEAADVAAPDWVRFVEDANEAIRLLHVKLEYLQMVHTRRLMIRFDGAEDQHEREIDLLNDEVAGLFQRADRALKQITRPFVGGQPSASPADRLVRTNTQRSLAMRLQRISVEFRRRQREYLHRLQLQKFGSDVFDFDPDDGDASTTNERGDTAQAELAIEMQRFRVESRDAEIQRIARSVAALATIFKEVAEMVIDQGTLVDRIDYNMEQVATRMRSGLKELERADRYQRATRPERCIQLLLAAIYVCFLLLVVKHF